MFLTPLAPIPQSATFWNLFRLVRLLVHIPSPKLRSQNFTSPRFTRLLDQLRNEFVARRLLHSYDLNHAVALRDCPANEHRLTEIEHKHDNETATTIESQKGWRHKSGDTQTHTAELQETGITNLNELQVW